MSWKKILRVVLAVVMLLAAMLLSTQGGMVNGAMAAPFNGPTPAANDLGSLADLVVDHVDAKGKADKWHHANCAQPPDNSVQDHATFTDAELQKYSLDPRPTEGANGGPVTQADMDHWTYLVRHQNHRSCELSTIDNPKTINDGTNVYNQSMWSGWGATNNNSTVQFNGASTNFYAPCIVGSGPVTGSSEHVSVWAGVGGANKGNLVQSGVDVYWYDDTLQGWIVKYDVFVENTGYIINTELGVTVSASCGSYMYARDGYGTGYSNGMEIDNLSTGQYDTEHFGPNPGIDSAECMAERIQSPAYNLIDYNPIHFYNCIHHDPWHGWDAVGASETTGPQINPAEWQTVDSSGFLLQYPTSYGSDQESFTNYYVSST